MPALEVRLVAALAARGGTLAVAESLTGGEACARLVAVPGASSVLRGGVVAYLHEVKADLLGVDPALLATAGAVDARVAAQMAAGVARRLGADHGVATTGVAGPGPSEGHAPGTVFVAAWVRGQVRVRRLSLAGTRPLVRTATARAALALLAGSLDDGAGHGRDGDGNIRTADGVDTGNDNDPAARPLHEPSHGTGRHTSPPARDAGCGVR